MIPKVINWASHCFLAASTGWIAQGWDHSHHTRAAFWFSIFVVAPYLVTSKKICERFYATHSSKDQK